MAALVASTGALLAAAAVAFVPGAAGHAGQTSPRGLTLVLDGLHVLSGSVWFGGLIGLLVLWATVGTRLRVEALSVVVPRFSKVALASVIVLAGTGVGEAIVHMPTARALWKTSYGVAILAFNHTEMQMPQQECQLIETHPGVYARWGTGARDGRQVGSQLPDRAAGRRAVHRADSRPGQRMRPLLDTRQAAVLVAGSLLGLSGCGSSSGGGVTVPKVAPARVFSLAAFSPSGPIMPGRPVTISFTVRMPSGKPLTQYRTGPGPHTGVNLVIVRKDLAYIIHQHPSVSPDGRLAHTVTFPACGPYRVLVDMYPNIPGGLPNLQLFRNVNVTGPYHSRPLPPFTPRLIVGGYHFDMAPHPQVHAIQARFLHVTVTDPAGRKGARSRSSSGLERSPTRSSSRRSRLTTSTPTSARPPPPTEEAWPASAPAA